MPQTMPMMAGIVKPPPWSRCSRPLCWTWGTLGMTVTVVWGRGVEDVAWVIRDDGGGVVVALVVCVGFEVDDVELFGMC